MWSGYNREKLRTQPGYLQIQGSNFLSFLQLIPEVNGLLPPSHLLPSRALPGRRAQPASPGPPCTLVLIPPLDGAPGGGAVSYLSSCPRIGVLEVCVWTGGEKEAEKGGKEVEGGANGGHWFLGTFPPKEGHFFHHRFFKFFLTLIPQEQCGCRHSRVRRTRLWSGRRGVPSSLCDFSSDLGPRLCPP